MPVFELFYNKTYSVFVRARSEKSILLEDIDFESIDGNLHDVEYKGAYLVEKQDEASVRKITIPLSKIPKHT